MEYLSTDYNLIVKEQEKNLSAKKTQSDTNINSVYDSQKNTVSNEHNKLVGDTKVAYESEYEKNAVQKLINEKQIAESMANLGLTDSGLNRTQQTAAQLSYANQKGDIDLAKQGALDTLSQNLASSIAAIEQNRTIALNDNAKYWDGIANSNAQNVYAQNLANNQALDEMKQADKWNQKNLEYQYAALAEQQRQFNLGKNQVSAGGGVGHSAAINKDESTTSPKTSGGVDENTKITLQSQEEYGTFKNGYQPKGIVGHGALHKSGDKVIVNGKEQNIWVADDDTYWKWVGAKMRYEPFEYPN